MHFQIARAKIEDNFVSHSGGPKNNLIPMNNFPGVGVQGKLKWMPWSKISLPYTNGIELGSIHFLTYCFIYDSRAQHIVAYCISIS